MQENFSSWCKVTVLKTRISSLYKEGGELFLNHNFFLFGKLKRCIFLCLPTTPFLSFFEILLFFFFFSGIGVNNDEIPCTRFLFLSLVIAIFYSSMMKWE